MADRIDMLLAMQGETQDDIRDLHTKIDTVNEKVGSYSLQTETRLTKVESVVSLRNRVGAAVVALLPALGMAVYFLIQYLG
jgi:hypothetical protein